MGVPTESLLDLSASLNPVGPDVARSGGAAPRCAGPLPRRPPGRRLLAEAIGVEPERLLLTNGGAEAIFLLGQLVGGRVEEPDFSLYPRGTATAPRWRSNPHNPTGLLAGPDERADVWDEAFFPLATGRWSRHDDAAMAAVGSLTKVFACPGLRLGYLVADPELIAQLEPRQPPWAVGGLELALLPELLAAGRPGPVGGRDRPAPGRRSRRSWPHTGWPRAPPTPISSSAMPRPGSVTSSCGKGSSYVTVPRSDCPHWCGSPCRITKGSNGCRMRSTPSTHDRPPRQTMNDDPVMPPPSLAGVR